MSDIESSLFEPQLNVIREEPQFPEDYRLRLGDIISPSHSEADLLSSQRTPSYRPFMHDQSQGPSSVSNLESQRRPSDSPSVYAKELAVIGGGYYELKNITDSPKSYYEGLRGIGHEVSSSNSKFEIKLREQNLFERIEASPHCGILGKGLLRVPAGCSTLCQLIISTTLFEFLILGVIVANTVTLALEDPEDPDSTLEFLGLLFLCVYTVEAGLKILGLGFVLNPGAYLREGWNVLDFCIVITGWVEHIGGTGYNLRALRALRVIRPLRSISSIEGLKALIGALFSAMQPLLFAIIVFLFFLCVFAIAGVQLWMGLFRNRCFELDSGVMGTTVCGMQECGAGFECVRSLDNPNYGVTNFDNILYAFLAVFQCVTLEGWFYIMLDAQAVFGPFVLLFFVPLVFIGAFLMLNFILAVIKYHFTKVMDLQRHSKRKEHNLEESLNTSLIEQKSNEEELNQEEEVVFDPDPNLRHLSPLGENENPFGRHSTFRRGELPSPDRAAPGRKALIRTFTFKERVESFRSNPSAKRSFTRNALARVTLNGGSVKAKRQTVLKLRGRYSLASCVYALPEHERLIMRSWEDVEPSVIRPLLIRNESEYSFRYAQEAEESLVQQDILRKYNGNCFEVFSFLTSRHSATHAFHIVQASVRDLVFKAHEHDRITRQVLGQWSGLEIDPHCGVAGREWTKTLSKMRVRLWPRGWRGSLQKCRRPVARLVTSKWFGYTMTLAVVMNTVVLAMDHYGISEEMDSVLIVMNLVFTVVFMLEMLLKLIGLGVARYFRDTMNYLDASVVIVSSVELVFLSQTSGLTAFRTVRVFRTFRVLRVLRVARLFRYMNSMTAIIQVLGNSVYSFLYLAILLVLFIVIFALLGMQLFGGAFDFEEGTPRANFDNFHAAFVTVFQVLSMEDWQSILYDAMRSSAGKASALYFLAWIFLGNFVLLNLFLAILLDSFDQQDEDDDEEQETNESTYTLETDNDRKLRRNSLFGSSVALKQKKKKEENIQQLKKKHTIKQPQDTDDVAAPPGRSFYVFAPHGAVRRVCGRLVSSPMFEKLVLLLICVSSAKLVWDTYLLEEPEDSTAVKVSEYLDIAFTVLFLLEFLIKSINTGFLFEQQAYLREVWNQMDFAIVVMSVVELAVQNFNVPFIKVLRLLRTLRPLRIITHNVSMKLVVTALLESICAIVNVVIVLVIVWLMFAIMGVSLFAGKFYTCDQPLLETQTDCEAYGFAWVNAASNFDNVLEALTTLFVVSSLEGWPSIMHQAVDARAEGVAPEKDASPAAAYYFIVFILVGSFFFVNLFIGVIFMQFNLAKRNESAYSLVLNEKQMKWIEIQNLLVKAKPHFEVSAGPSDPVRRWFYFLAKHVAFEIFILTCILLNMLQMAIAYESASEDYEFALEMANLVFTVIFILEAVIKLTGLGFKGYFHNHWNKFDFFVVMTSLLDLSMSTFLGSDQSFLRTAPQLVRVIRVLRVSRLIRIVKTLKPLQDLLMVMAISLPAILNVLSLLLLIFFIYAVLGVFMFYSTASGEYIDAHTNFSNFGMAMVTLLRISTGENWNGIMYDAAKEEGVLVASVYFCSFIVITTFIMLNLFVMVIVQSYQDYKNNPKNPYQVFTADLKTIRRAWRVYAESEKGLFIKSRDLPPLMHELWGLDPKLGISPNLDYAKRVNELSTMDLIIDEGDTIFFNDFLYAVMKRRYGRKQRESHDETTKQIVKNRDLSTAARLKNLREKNKLLSIDEAPKKDYFLTMFYERTCFRAWRNWVRRKVERAGSEEEFPGYNSLSCI